MADASGPVVTVYLEMLYPAELRPQELPADFQVIRASVPCPELNRFLYETVGGPWSWRDKLTWSPQQWEQLVSQPGYGTWVGYWKGTPAGYFELDRQGNGDVEIAYFGLLPQFIGQGLGGALLTAAIRAAWDWGARRVWVHTCSLDHPAALANYQARGLRIYRQEERDRPGQTGNPAATVA